MYVSEVSFYFWLNLNLKINKNSNRLYGLEICKYAPIVSLFCLLEIIITSSSAQVALFDFDCRPKLRLEVISNFAELGR